MHKWPPLNCLCKPFQLCLEKNIEKVLVQKNIEKSLKQMKGSPRLLGIQAGSNGNIIEGQTFGGRESQDMKI